MNKSIRWTLLFWYGLILFLVIGSFGWVLVDRQKDAMYETVDEELKAHALAIAGALDMEDEDGPEFEMSREYEAYFEQGGRDSLYFAIWFKDGELMERSKTLADRAPPTGAGRHQRSTRREITINGPGDTYILVGRGTKELKKDIRRFRTGVIGIGGTVFLLALLGGFFLVGRLMQPIERMTTTAEAISESNLSERIDVGKTESELGRLAKTLNEAFDRIEKAFDRQTRFTADASHELRTPLSILNTNIEVTLRRDRNADEYKQSLETCLQATRRMKGIVEGLLALARTDAGETVLRTEEVDLKSLVAEATGMLQPLADGRKVKLTLDTGAASVKGDADRLRDVVANLVSNAIRYNKEGGEVSVRLRHEGGRVFLTVKDTGIGIPTADLAHIFERFYRVDKARSRELGGSGLGLAITKWIVESHGGEISVDSIEGEGTTFQVRLPASE